MNGRVQTDAMFAALFVLAIMSVCLYFLIDTALRRLVAWQPEVDPASFT
jgi:putative hydroxymethylpyrimidine transport system permease protein